SARNKGSSSRRKRAVKRTHAIVCDRSAGFIKLPMRQGLGHRNALEAGRDRLVAGHGDGNGIVRSRCITAPTGKSEAGVRHSRQGYTGAGRVAGKVRSAGEGAAGARHSVQAPLPRRQLVRRNLLARMLEEETHFTGGQRVIVNLRVVNQPGESAGW